MAIGHILFNDSTAEGRRLRNFLNNLASVINEGNALLQTMAQMTDGGQPGQYLADRFGFGVTPGGSVSTTGDLKTAQAGYDEFASLMGKLNCTGSDTTANVKDAIQQAVAKFG